MWNEKARAMAGWAYSGGVELTDYMLWKAVVVIVAAFFYGLWRGLTGRSGRGPSGHRE